MASCRPTVVCKGKKRMKWSPSWLPPPFKQMHRLKSLRCPPWFTSFILIIVSTLVWLNDTHDGMFRSLSSAPLLFFFIFLVTDVPYLQFRFDLYIIKQKNSRQVTVSNHESGWYAFQPEQRSQRVATTQLYGTHDRDCVLVFNAQSRQTRREHCSDLKVYHPYSSYTQLPGISFVRFIVFKSIHAKQMTLTFITNEDKTTVILKVKIELFWHGALKVLTREREKICKLPGVPKACQLDFCLKTERGLISIVTASDHCILQLVWRRL